MLYLHALASLPFVESHQDPLAIGPTGSEGRSGLGNEEENLWNVNTMVKSSSM